MTEYYNLRMAHELAEKYHNLTGDAIVIEHNCCFGCYVNVPCQFIINHVPTTFNSIRDMIKKLTELTQPDNQKPKYKDAWYLNSYGDIACTECLNQEGYVHCERTIGGSLGRKMYPSYEALIEAQIEHWSKLKLKSMSHKFEDDIKSIKESIRKCEEAMLARYEVRLECQHESDGNTHSMTLTQPDEERTLTVPGFNKCIKCGELYK